MLNIFKYTAYCDFFFIYHMLKFEYISLPKIEDNLLYKYTEIIPWKFLTNSLLNIYYKNFFKVLGKYILFIDSL